MQKLITKYGLAAHLAFLAVAPLFLSPVPIFWIAALGVVWLIMEPSRIGDEMLHGARRRVAGALVRDPLFWVLLVLCVLSGVRALNDGVMMSYDAELGNWTLARPNWPILPGCVKGDVGGLHLAMAVSLFVVTMGCAHALGRSARSAFALCAAAVSSCHLLIVSFFCRADQASFLQQVACSGENPAYSGMVYGILLLLAIVSLCAVFENRWWGALPLTAVALIGNALGLFLFAPPYLTALFGCALILLLLYSFVYLRVKIGRLSDFKYLVVVGLSLTFAGMAAMTILPESALAEKLAPFQTGDFLPRNLFPAREALSRISLSIWKEHPWLGTGLGSFAMDLNFHAAEADWRVISPLQVAPLNGYWLLLVERGVIGVFCIVVPLMMALIAYVLRIAQAARQLPHPMAFTAVIVLIVAGASLLLDCSALMSSAYLFVLPMIALSANAFAKKEDRHG